MKKYSTLIALALVAALSACASPASNTKSAADTPATQTLLEKAATGDVRAMEEACGMGPVQKFEDMGNSWCEKAAEAGSIYAMLELSTRYDTGMVFTPDAEKARTWLQRAAHAKPRTGDDSNDSMYVSEAWGTLATAYEYGQMGMKPDARQAFSWHRKGAEAGWPNSYLPLAHMYDTGLGVKQDFKAAAKWYRAAAEGGQAEAYHQLAIHYMKGLGVPRDLSQAYLWYGIALRHGQGPQSHAPMPPPVDSGNRLTQSEIDSLDRQAREWTAKR